MEDEGRIRISTSTGALITSDIVLEAFVRESKRIVPAEKDNTDDDIQERKAALRHYVAVVDRIIEQKKRFRESRNMRLHILRVKASLGRYIKKCLKFMFLLFLLL